jgi:hypothetical protein
LSVALLQASIGLAGFSFLLWSTLPWAFIPMIDRDTLDDTDGGYTRAKYTGWIRQGTQLFFISGLFFTVDILNEIYNFQGQLLFVFSSIPFPVFLVAGLVTFASGIGFTYAVIDWITTPEEELIAPVIALGMELFILIGFTVFEVIDLYMWTTQNTCIFTCPLLLPNL